MTIYEQIPSAKTRLIVDKR